MISTRALSDSALAISTRCRLATESELTGAVDVELVDLERGQDLRRRACVIARQSTPPQRVRGAWPRKMFSATVRSGNSSSSWNTVAMPAACAACGPLKRTSWPSTRIVPASGR